MSAPLRGEVFILARWKKSYNKTVAGRNISTSSGAEFFQAMLDIKERQTGDVTILDLEGSIIMGGGSARLRETVRRLIGQDRKNVVLNLADVKYIDSSGVGELVSSSVALGRASGYLKLSNLHGKVEEVLTLSSLLPFFELYEGESGKAKSDN